MTSAVNVAQYGSPGNSLGFKNRIINGDMRIDQRNAGASVTLTSGNLFPVDRMNCQYSGSGVITGQRSSTVPTGFSNSIVFTTSTGSSPATGVVSRLLQSIEGFNIADLGWGTVNAQPVTLSFWVRSSLTGTFGGCLQAGSSNGNYVFQYTINAANTWEQKTITVPGATIGTWYTDNSTGIQLYWDLGSGSTFEATANTWTTGINKWRSSGNVQLSATTGATFYITGVQLEKGTVATPFEYRDYGRELSLCQRYCVLYAAGAGEVVGSGMNWTSASYWCPVRMPVTMRSTPTLSCTTGTNYYQFFANGSTYKFTAVSDAGYVGTANLGNLAFTGTGSGLTAGNGNVLQTYDAAAKILYTAEL